MLIRPANSTDADQILAIYAPYIYHSAITFETEVPSAEDFKARVARIIEKYPWLVCEEEGQIIGYAYAGGHRDRIAYQWSVEISVYINEAAHGRGVATHLYQALLALLKIQGVVNIYALITVPNLKSIALHARFGFKELIVFEKIGYKEGAWHDVQWMLLVINAHEKVQSAPIPFVQLRNDSRLLEILEKENSSLNGESNG